MRKDQVSIQLYTVRSILAESFEEGLSRIAQSGYEYVEFAGYHGRSAAEARQLLDTNGLRASSAHIQLEEFRTRIDGVIDDIQTLGMEWGIIPAIPGDLHNEAGIRAVAAEFEQFGAKLADAGLKFGYHNHDFEFLTTTGDGQTLFDLLVEITSPDVVAFELDAFWAAVGGFDPAAVVREHADRIKLVHLKDGREGEVERGKDLPFGAGNLPMDDFLAACRTAGVEWYVTEQDNPNPDDILGDVTTAYENAVRLAI